MAHAPLIAQKIAEVLTATACHATTEGESVHVPKWGVRIDVMEGKTSERPGTVMVTPSIETRHPLFPNGCARELGVGRGRTLKEAADGVSANWALLFYPLLKFLFEDHPHDCLVADWPLELPADKQLSYRLFAGPLQFMGFDEDSAPAHPGQDLLFKTAAHALLPKLSPGVHHIRCFVGAFADGVRGDVFVDGDEWPECSQLLRQLAAAFPAADDQHLIHSYKQHLLVRPDDLAAGERHAAEHFIRAHSAAIEGRVSPANRPLLPTVLRGLFETQRVLSHDQAEAPLLAAGTDPATLGRLVSFLPSACARVVLGPKPKYSQTYLLRNPQTNRAVERRYDQTPVFCAALETVTALWNLNLARVQIYEIGLTSAEVNTVIKAKIAADRLDTFSFTCVIHATGEPVEGPPLDEVIERVERRNAETRSKPAPVPTASGRPAPPPPISVTPAHVDAARKKAWWQFW